MGVSRRKYQSFEAEFGDRKNRIFQVKGRKYQSFEAGFEIGTENILGWGVKYQSFEAELERKRKYLGVRGGNIKVSWQNLEFEKENIWG